MTCDLQALEPEWIEVGGRIVGVLFSCPACSRWGADLVGAHMVGVLFANPPDGGPAHPDDENAVANNGGRRWSRSGSTFDDLTITPSIDLTARGAVGEWHGFVTAGHVT